MQSTEALYERLASLAEDPDTLIGELVESLAAEGRWHEVFDARLLAARRRLGLPFDQTLLDAPATAQGPLEEAYRQACIEAGEGLLRAGRAAEAWRYLGAAGERERMRAALRATTPDEQNAEELIELALYQGVLPELGFRWLLERYGTCNAVTTLEGLGGQLPPDELRPCVLALVDWLTEELAESLARHIESHEGAAPRTRELGELIAGRDWLFNQAAAHVDASHLAAAVRWARVLDEPPAVRKAAQLAEYGRRLDPTLQYPDAPPFEQTYPAHLLYFQAILGERVDEAVDQFRRSAEERQGGPDGPTCVETYLRVLQRAGRPAEALAEYARLVAPDAPLSPWAPRALDLAKEAGDWRAYDQLMRVRGDAVGYAAGLLARRAEA